MPAFSMIYATFMAGQDLSEGQRPSVTRLTHKRLQPFAGWPVTDAYRYIRSRNVGPLGAFL